MKEMLVKLDENMAQNHVEFLRQAGYDADRVTDEGLSGADDTVVWQQVCAEERFFITLATRLFGCSSLRTWYTPRYFITPFSQPLPSSSLNSAFSCYRGATIDRIKRLSCCCG
jgi:hypothetical protein